MFTLGSVLAQVLVLVGLGKQLKQTIRVEHNNVKNPNWPGANKLAIYKSGQRSELRATEKQIQVMIRVGFEPGAAGL